MAGGKWAGRNGRPKLLVRREEGGAEKWKRGCCKGVNGTRSLRVQVTGERGLVLGRGMKRVEIGQLDVRFRGKTLRVKTGELGHSNGKGGMHRGHDHERGILRCLASPCLEQGNLRGKGNLESCSAVQ
jgi:hypothetical protein